MQIVIEIDDNLYTRLFDNGVEYASDMRRACVAIRNGTPLPKGHGRLIDADWVKNTLDIYTFNEYNGQFIRRNDVDSIPAIIEADKEKD